MATALRGLLATVRTWGHLPAPVVQRLKRDAKAMGLGPLEYVQMALHRRYQELAKSDRVSSRVVLQRGRRARRRRPS
jgi:hypothetical protein